MNNPGRRQLWADAALLLVTLVWGSTFVMVKAAVTDYPVFPFLTLRFALATLALLAIGGKRLRSLGKKGVGAGVLIGLFLFSGYALQTVGLQHTSASKAGFITGLSVVLVPVLSMLLLRRFPSLAALTGVCLATLGLALFTLTQGLDIAVGDLLVLVCALSFALHIVSLSVFAPKMDPLALTIVQVATATLASALVSLFRGQPTPFPIPTPATWFAAGFTGLLATAGAFFIQTAMQRFTTPTHTALIFVAEPVFAALFGVLLVGDVMTARSIAGGVLIMAGAVVGEIHWSERAARIISRFLSPQYVAVPLLVVLGLSDARSWQRGLLWAAAIGLIGILAPLLIMSRELRRGKISDWHISNRKERLQPVPIIVSFCAVLAPLGLLVVLHGPKLLLVAMISVLCLIVCNLLITLRWKVSQHVSSIAVGATMITAALGIGVAPVLFLIPLVAWARVKVEAHTVMQTIVGGTVGVTITLATLRFYGVV